MPRMDGTGPLGKGPMTGVDNVVFTNGGVSSLQISRSPSTTG